MPESIFWRVLDIICSLLYVKTHFNYICFVTLRSHVTNADALLLIKTLYLVNMAVTTSDFLSMITVIFLIIVSLCYLRKNE